MQWANTVRDLFGLTDAASFTSDFRLDPRQNGFLFSNDVGSMSVDDALWSAYQRAAASLAERVASDAALLDAILPAASLPDAERAAAFIETFGAKVHRRPLTAGQVQAYQALYDGAVGAYAGLSDFDAGIRLLIEAFLQSPHFIYRIEASTTEVGEVIPLDGYEVASRLSYMLWNTMPDEALSIAARDGGLSLADQVAAEAVRMLADDRARNVILDFHHQLLELERYKSIAPAPAFYPNAPATLAESAEQENTLFLDEMIANRGASLTELLTTNETFVNADLAAIYGLPGTYGAAFEPATLDPTQRRGLLTQVGFLASHSSTVNPDPIHRGVFVAKRIVCTHIAAPPNNVPPLPPEAGRTNRETIEDQTEQPGSVCASCHATIINPLGFPFEGYDSTGAYRTLDNGFPVDTSSVANVGGEQVPVNDALDLVSALVASPDVHECYAKHWLEFAYGRGTHDLDAPLVERLGAASLDDEVGIKELIVGLVKTESFLTRSVEELP